MNKDLQGDVDHIRLCVNKIIYKPQGDEDYVCEHREFIGKERLNGT